MTKLNFLWFFLFSTSCNQNSINENNTSEALVTTDKTAILVDSISSSEVNTISTQILDVKEFSSKKYFSGTVHQLFFEDEENVSITFERYYDGRWGKHTITGKYSIVDNTTIKVNWIESNTISWLNTWGECGMQTVNQSESFSDILSFNSSSNCVSASTTFRQSFYIGNRCGNEDKSENGLYEFCLN